MNPEKPFTRLLADLPEALAQDDIFVNELKSHARVITLKKGDLLLRTGEVCQNAYFINKGLFVKEGMRYRFLFRRSVSFPFRNQLHHSDTFQLRDQGARRQ